MDFFEQNRMFLFFILLQYLSNFLIILLLLLANGVEALLLKYEKNVSFLDNVRTDINSNYSRQTK